MLSRTLQALLVLCLLAPFTSAQELYDPAPPADAAFIRVIQAVPNLPAITAEVNGKAVAKGLAYKKMSAYTIVPQGKHQLTITAGKEKKVPFEVQAGRFYTVALTGTPANPQVTRFEDTVNPNLAKAQIFVYNLSGAKSVDLKTGDGKVTVIPAVARAGTKHILVNPIKVDLSLYADGAKALDIAKAFTLHASNGYSAVVFGVPGNLGAVWVQNTTAK